MTTVVEGSVGVVVGLVGESVVVIGSVGVVVGLVGESVVVIGSLGGVSGSVGSVTTGGWAVTVIITQ